MLPWAEGGRARPACAARHHGGMAVLAFVLAVTLTAALLAAVRSVLDDVEEIERTAARVLGPPDAEGVYHHPPNPPHR